MSEKRKSHRSLGFSNRPCPKCGRNMSRKAKQCWTCRKDSFKKIKHI